jgi:hypothetical protein
MRRARKEEATVTCYFRHLKGIFEKAGIEVTAANKRELDALLHELVHVKYKQCPAAWRGVKELLARDADELAGRLKAAWRKRPPPRA